MSCLYNLKSHPHQSLYNHLTQVRDIAIKTHKSHMKNEDIELLIKVVCICHDFGKGTTYFQKYLDGEYVGVEKNHGLISALFTYWMLPTKWKHLGFLIVKKHHGDIDNAKDETSKDDTLWRFKNQISDINKNTIEELSLIYKEYLDEKSINDFLEWISDDKNVKSVKRDFIKKKFSIEDLLLCEYVYSLLLTADKSQLIRNDSFVPSKPYPSDFIKNYKDKLIKEAINKNPKLKQSSIFNIRNDIYNDMFETLNNIDFDKYKIFSINVPTGTGKTILAYQAAFYIANKIYTKDSNIRPNIIYSLPFTSVIDQNYEVLLDIIKYNTGDEVKSDDLLKFHSVTPIEYTNFDGYDARFCFENWQSKVISTTFVQLLNTIFKIGKNSIVNRFHRLANSVIILDEVQAIDEKYYMIIKIFLEKLSKEYNCYIILVTATMPMLLKSMELINKKEEYFKALNRIEIINNSQVETSIENFKEIVLEDILSNEDKSFLIVLNTVKSSKYTYDYIKDNCDREISYLSTEIYPKLRLEKIDEIKKSNKKYIVVSTQLIEAGVDIDMDVVYRDFSTLDSINQTAGRANRNGISGKGIVKLYKLIDNNDRRYCNYIYPRYLLNATEEVLEDKPIIEEKDIYELNLEYFNKVNKRLSNDKSKNMLKLIDRLEFKKFRDEFELIDNDEFIREDITININEETQKILSTLQNKDNIESIELKNMFRTLRQYTVSISKKELHIDKTINYKEIDRYKLKYIDKEDYDKEKGIIRIKDIIF